MAERPTAARRGRAAAGASRRRVLAGLAGAGGVLLAGALVRGGLAHGTAMDSPGPRVRLPSAAFDEAFAAIESQVGGRLGVAVLAADGALLGGRRLAELFPLASTFKLLLGAQVLARVEAGAERLDARVAYGRRDLVAHSPVTGPRLESRSASRLEPDGLAVEELLEAMLTLSDNTAANLLLARVGGPTGLTAWLRGLGDPVTRLVRWETELNEAEPGDPRDTTTPGAMAGTVHALLLGDALPPAARERLLAWLRASRTGDSRLRAGLAAGWTAAERTGSAAHGTSNDVGVLWAPDGEAWVVAAYLTECDAPPDARDRALAGVARTVVGYAGAAPDAA